MNINEFFNPYDPEKINDNTFNLMEKDWLLITAGDMNSFNTMTAAWAGLGVLWKKKVVFCFIRPQRYTYQFVEKHDFFTVSFYDEQYRKALNICGNTSGRDHDKVKAAGLTPLETEHGSIVFKESRLFFECRKIYFNDLESKNFLVPEIEKCYPTRDYHRMYIGEIVSCFEQKK